MKKNLFERHPKTTLLVLIILFGVSALFLLELSAKYFFGLGKPLLYDNSVIYGYRPLPNQTISRHAHQVVHTNNLGYRANQDWDNNPNQKILFLGDSVTYGGSYIDNQKLFSHIALEQISNFTSANAGVNGWGINNVEAYLTSLKSPPAQIYVSVFPEGDFYRGLTRIGGQPFWSIEPKFALQELFFHFIYQISLYKTPPVHYLGLPNSQRETIVNIAAQNLKKLNSHLKQQDCAHLIYITPTRSQVLNQAQRDHIVASLLAKHQIKVIYLKDRIDLLNTEQKQKLYHDEIHLSEFGHQVWGHMIGHDLRQLTALLPQNAVT